MKNLKKYLSVLAISTIVISQSSFANETAKKMPTQKVDVYIVQKKQDVQVALKYPATVTAFNKIDVIARVLGTLEKQNFAEGKYVKQGDVLFNIEDDTYLALLNEAKASLKVNEATFKNAKLNWNRIKKLYKQKAVSQDKRDDALYLYEQSMASVALAKAKLKQAQIQYDYTKVKAPISGITGLKKVDKGTLVQANVSQLVQITQIDKVYAQFSMPMSDFKRIKDHKWVTKENNQMSIHVIINGKKSPLKGIIDFTDVNVDQNTAIVKMRALIDNKDGILMPGQFIRIELDNIIEKDTTIIPQKAVLQNPAGTIVFVANGGKVGVRPVTIEREIGKNYILKNPMLKVGDKVIVNNFFRIQPGNDVIIDKTINK